jgi:predicted nucleic acid-binding protein
MNVCFADSFYYLALLNRRDASHERVTALARALNGPAVTTAWVLTEVADALSHPAQRASVVRLVQTLRASARTEIVPPPVSSLSADGNSTASAPTRTGR